MMTKAQLSTLLHSLNIPVGEGEHFLDSEANMPKVAYWERIWNDAMASGDDYDTIVNYQISMFSRRPRDPSLIALKTALNEAGIHPEFYIEYVKSEKGPGYYHTACTVDVEEDINVAAQ